MLQRHKDVLSKNNFYIMTHLDIKAHPKIVQYLYEKRILLKNHVEEINAGLTNKESIYTFLDILPRRGAAAFDTFLESLHQNYYDFIEETLLLCLGEENKFIPTLIPEDNTDSVIQCMGSQKKIILIINNNDFKDPDMERLGSKEDTEDLIFFFVKSLGYDLYNKEPYLNLSVERMNSVLMAFANYIKEFSAGLAIIVIMTHGSARYVLGSDDQNLDISVILKTFENVNDSVLKAFIFSCCRGAGSAIAPKGDIVDSIIKQEGSCTVNDLIINGRIDDESRSYWKMAPPFSIVLYSTQKDFYSYRYESGTIFIRSLLSVFREKHMTDSLRTMVMAIRPMMKKLYPDYTQTPDVKENYFTDLKLI